MAAWKDIPITKTDSGVRIDIEGVYYYPYSKKASDRGHGHLLGGKEINVPFEDEIELLDGLSQILRRAKQLAAKP